MSVSERTLDPLISAVGGENALLHKRSERTVSSPSLILRVTRHGLSYPSVFSCVWLSIHRNAAVVSMNILLRTVIRCVTLTIGAVFGAPVAFRLGLAFLKNPSGFMKKVKRSCASWYGVSRVQTVVEFGKRTPQTRRF